MEKLFFLASTGDEAAAVEAALAEMEALYNCRNTGGGGGGGFWWKGGDLP